MAWAGVTTVPCKPASQTTNELHCDLLHFGRGVSCTCAACLGRFGIAGTSVINGDMACRFEHQQHAKRQNQMQHAHRPCCLSHINMACNG